MLRRLVVFGTALMMICGFAVTGIGFGGPTGAAAAGGYGVGPSQTGATGTARACEATALNHGLSYANGFTCVPGTPSLATSYDQSTCTLTLTGSGLIPSSEVYYYSVFYGVYADAGMVDSGGNFTTSYTFLPGFTDTMTPYVYAQWTSPWAGSTPYLSGSAITFTC